ncbi:MAG: double-strand break repair protein AddB, partial [Pseudomonadota bacterium]
MFEHSAAPRVFYVPPGADFPAAVIAGLATRLKAPDAWARTHILCNAGRMVSRLREVLEEGPPRLLPRLSLITDLKSLAPHLTSAPPVAGLRRQLDLARDLRAISGLAAPLDIARALAVLLDEMDGEGVPFARLQDLDVSDQSGHWARALAIVQTAAAYKPGLGPEAVYRAQVLDLIDAWQDAPPAHPVLVAGSTGSRGTTARLMQAVARLPQGALILPGFDPNTPQNVWKELWEKRHEDHPQFRYAALLHTLELDPKAIEPWAGSLTPNPERADFLSLALRPAPVTHHWRRDSPKAADLSRATDDITLVEAKDQRAEATAIALRLREAVEAGQRAALISPDRGLTRRVAAALARWDLVPDDSAGVPLSLTPPGRLLSQIARLGTQGVAADTLIALLKHPLVSTGANRGEHLLKTRALELKLRRKGPPFPTPVDVATWAEEDPTRTSWGAWLGPLLAPNDAQTLPDHLAWLMHATETLCAGPEAPETTGALWEEAPGRAAKATLEAMTEVSAPEDTLSAQDFTVLLGQTLAAESL